MVPKSRDVVMKDVQIRLGREEYVEGTVQREERPANMKGVLSKNRMEEFVGGMAQKQKSRLALLKDATIEYGVEEFVKGTGQEEILQY